MKVQIACTSDELEAGGRLRYAVYVEELGKTLELADHLPRQVRDVHDADALHLFVAARGEMVGCVRIHANAVPEVLADPLELWRFHFETSRDFALVSKLIVQSAHRHATAFGRLLGAVHKLADQLRRSDIVLYYLSKSCPHVSPNGVQNLSGHASPSRLWAALRAGWFGR